MAARRRRATERRARATAAKGERPGARRSKKGEATRARLVQTAFALFEKDGFEKTTLRAIAAKAGVSLGLLYRYYPSKDALVVELYDDLSQRFVRRSAALPEGPWVLRVLRLLRVSLDVLAPHREALRAMVPSLTVAPGHPLFIPGGQPSHLRVQSRFEAAVAGASDAPENAARLGRQLYLAHLGLVLAWLLDRSPGQRATRRGFALVERWAPLAAALSGSGALSGLTGPVGDLLELAVLGKRGNAP